MSDWKADYLRMWEIYFGRPMSLRGVDMLMNDTDGGFTIEAHINGYKYGKLLEALGRLKSPN